jgi:hypothetical protein
VARASSNSSSALRRRGCRWSYTAFRRVDRAGVPLAAERTRRFDPHEGDIFRTAVFSHGRVRTPSVVVERALLLETGASTRSPLGEDYDLWMRLRCAARSPCSTSRWSTSVTTT